MPGIKLFFVMLTAGLALLPGCGRKPAGNYCSMDGFALGTSYHFIVNAADTTGLRRQVDSLFEAADASMSVYRRGSLLNRLNANETDSVDTHIARCIEIARQVSELSGGVYDITVKPLTQAWGFTGQDAQFRPNVDSLLQYVGYKKIRIENGRLIKERPEIQIDLNSVAKGYIVDLMGQLMSSRGAKDYLVEIGGEVVCRGKSSRGGNWVVAVDKPSDGNYVPGADVQVKLSFSGKGLATSGNYRKFYYDADGRKIVHTINAVTGESSPGNLLSATALAPDCATADALGTAMMALGLERSEELLRSHPEYSGYLIYSGNDGNYEIFMSESVKKMIVE